MGMGLEQKLLTVSEFSRCCGISEPKLRQLDVAGKLIAVRTSGGHRRYREEQISESVAYVKRMKLLPGGRNVVVDGQPIDSFFAYILGLVMADGTVSAKGQVQLEMKDKQIMDDIASIMKVEVHPRKTRPMFQLAVPRPMANMLVEYGVCRRKSQGFDIPEMTRDSFGCFLRGLFDGDGSIRHRKSSTIVRFHGHPRSMAHIQATFMESFGLYLPWVQDNRLNSGMLETSQKETVEVLRCLMYKTQGPRLRRKQELFASENKE